MNRFYQMYQPHTAEPYRSSQSYREISPCGGLKPYVKCFWGTNGPLENTGINQEGLIVPDTCMDIIFQVSHTNNNISGKFVGINNEAFYSAVMPEECGKPEIRSTFGIRFFAWSAVLFSEDSMEEIKNNVFDVRRHYGRIQKAIEPLLYDVPTLEGRAAEAEKILLKQLNEKRHNPCLETAVYHILKQKGNLKTAGLAEQVFISKRQLERVFREYMGISPKQFASLVRYQSLWNELLTAPVFDVMNAVHRYGFSDQSHLLHEFRKYHTMLPGEARQFACRRSAMENDGMVTVPPEGL